MSKATCPTSFLFDRSIGDTSAERKDNPSPKTLRGEELGIITILSIVRVPHDPKELLIKIIRQCGV